MPLYGTASNSSNSIAGITGVILANITRTGKYYPVYMPLYGIISKSWVKSHVIMGRTCAISADIVRN